MEEQYADTTSFTAALDESTSYADVPTPASTSTESFESFSIADLAKAREQEKQKLYPQMERLKEELASLRKDRDDREAEDARAKADALAEATRRAEEDMDLRSLLQKKELEWGERLDEERTQRETALALLERERVYQEVQMYRQQRLEAEREHIIPELLDLVDGESQEDIENSIAGLKDRSNRILDAAQQAMSSAKRDMAGTRITTPAAGPLDTNSDSRNFSPEDIKNMSLTDYQKYRDRLLGSASSSRGRGLFG